MREHKFTFSSQESALNFINQMEEAGIDWFPKTVNQQGAIWVLSFECDKRSWGQIMSLS